MSVRHVSMTIVAARKHWDIFDMPKEEVMKQLDQMEKEGKRLIKSEGCNNFDYLKGCMGHDDMARQKNLTVTLKDLPKRVSKGRGLASATAETRKRVAAAG